MRRRLSALVMGLPTAMTLTLGAQTAFAGTYVVVWSTNNSAEAHFDDYGEHLYACDIKGDGLRAVAIAGWWSGGVYRTAEVQDADGDNGNCAGHANLDIVDGTSVTIWACARNGATGAAQYCSSATAIA